MKKISFFSVSECSCGIRFIYDNTLYKWYLIFNSVINIGEKLFFSPLEFSRFYDKTLWCFLFLSFYWHKKKGIFAPPTHNWNLRIFLRRHWWKYQTVRKFVIHCLLFLNINYSFLQINVSFLFLAFLFLFLCLLPIPISSFLSVFSFLFFLSPASSSFITSNQPDSDAIITLAAISFHLRFCQII